MVQRYNDSTGPRALLVVFLIGGVVAPGCRGAPLGLPSRDAGAVDAGRDAGPDAGPGDAGVVNPCGVDCGASGEVCLVAAGEAPRCGPRPGRCSDLPAGGLCADDDLYVCHAGSTLRLSCAGLGGRCASGRARPGCLPRPGGERVVAGRVTLDKRPYGPGGLGAAIVTPAVGATVVLHRTRDGSPIGLATTDVDGAYRIEYDASPGAEEIYLRVLALDFSPRDRSWVTDEAGQTYAWQSAVRSDGGGPSALHLHVDESDDAGALNIFAVLHQLGGKAQTLVGRPLPPLRAKWERGRELPPCQTCWLPTAETIHLLGRADDPDEYDDAVIAHEFGHYLTAAVSRDDSPGGAHNGDPTLPAQAWSEGLATFLGLTLIGDSLYVDTRETGTRIRDPEDSGWEADPLGPLTQDVSEYVVLEILWDITDPAEPPLDPLALPAPAVLGVLTDFLVRPDLPDRGISGVDLVDFLDGWFCQGVTNEADLRPIVEQVGFPYDFPRPPVCDKPGQPLSVDVDVDVDAGRVVARVADAWAGERARVSLVLPPGVALARGQRRTQTIAPGVVGAPRAVSWVLAPGARPAWVRVGVTARRGGRNRDHVTGSWGSRGPARGPAPFRVVDLGGGWPLRLIPAGR